MMLKGVILLVVLAALSCVDGKRDKTKGKRLVAKIPGMPRGGQPIAIWSRALVDSSKTVQEGAYSSGSNQIIVVSKDRGLARDQYMKSITVFDFTGGSLKTAIKVKSLKGCLVLTTQPADKTKAALASEIGALNNTVVGATPPVTIYAAAMPNADEKALRASRPELASKCGKKKFMMGETTEPAGFSSGTTLLATTYGQQLSIRAPGRSKVDKKKQKANRPRGGKS